MRSLFRVVSRRTGEKKGLNEVPGKDKRAGGFEEFNGKINNHPEESWEKGGEEI